MTRTISILGCGWFGTKLGETLQKADWLVKGSTRTEERFKELQDRGILPYVVDFDGKTSDYDPNFFDASILVIAIPPGRATGNESVYPLKIEQILKAEGLKDMDQIILISSTSVYGDHNNEVDEFSLPLPDNASGIALLEAEKALREGAGGAVTIIRFGGLVGPGRDPGRFFAGKRDIANGLAPVNLIHLEDCVGLTMAIIEQRYRGATVNAVAPSHPTRSVFYTKAALKSGYPMPEFIQELKHWKIIKSIRLSADINYHFKVANWEEWLI